MDWDDVSFVLGSKTRKAVLAKLHVEKTPTMLAQELHTSTPNISRALRELESKGLIELITPNSRVGKIFRATERGREVMARVREMDSP